MGYKNKKIATHIHHRILAEASATLVVAATPTGGHNPRIGGRKSSRPFFFCE
jgi:hypothetical protein